MVESLTEFHFLRPFWLLAMLPLLVLWLWRHYQQRRYGNWLAVVDPALQPYVLTQTQGKQPPLRWWPLLAAFLALLALAGPTWERLPQPVFNRQAALVIALDLSRSMDATDVKPSRLQRARHKIADILQQRVEGQTALLVYAAAAFTVTPLTTDTATILAQLNALNTDLLPAQGSRPDKALLQAQTLLQQAGSPYGQVLLITDGVTDLNAIRQAQTELANAGYSLSILGVGTEQGAPIPLATGGFMTAADGSIVIAKLNATELKSLARYQGLTVDDSDIRALLTDDFSAQADWVLTEQQTDIWHDRGYWLLLPLLLLAALAFRRGILLLLLGVLLPMPDSAYALDWQTLWQSPNQRAAELLNAKQPAEAAELFTDPEWQAAAYYRAGDYAAAAERLSGIDTPQANYNRGNALAQQGKYKEAIAAYEATLAAQPDHADAKYNRDLLLQQAQQSESAESDKGDQGSGDTQAKQTQSAGGAQPQSEQQNASAQPQNGEPDANESDATASNNSAEQQASQQAAEPGAQDTAAQQQAEAAQQPEPTDSAEQQQALQAQMAKEGTEQEQQSQINQQWLKQIPDDPGGLLRRKFLYQSKQQQHTGESDEPW